MYIVGGGGREGQHPRGLRRACDADAATLPREAGLHRQLRYSIV